MVPMPMVFDELAVFHKNLYYYIVELSYNAKALDHNPPN